MGGVWKDLRGNCGFWDGSCRAIGSGAVKVFTQALGWHTLNQSSAPVHMERALDAEIRGCEMPVECMGKSIGR